MPVLIGLGLRARRRCQPWIAAARPAARRTRPPTGRSLVWLLVFLAGVYGGYFGAAQGVLLIAIMGIGMAETMQRINAAKNVLALLVNAVAAVVFIAVSDIAWEAAGLIAAGSILGGQSARPSAAGCRRRSSAASSPWWLSVAVVFA